MTPIVVACVGSPFGADRLGHLVAEILRTYPALRALPQNLLRIEASDRPQLNLLHQIEGAQLAIIVDAVLGAPSGQIMHMSPDQLADEAGRMSSHGVGVAETLALGRELNLLPTCLKIIGLGIGAADENAIQNLPSYEDLENLADSIVDEVTCFARQLD